MDTYATDDYASIAARLREIEGARSEPLQPETTICWAIWCQKPGGNSWLAIEQVTPTQARYRFTDKPTLYSSPELAEAAIAKRRLEQPQNTYTVREYLGE